MDTLDWKTLEFAGKLVQAKSFEDWAEGQGKALVEKLGVEAGGVVLGFGTAKRGSKHRLGRTSERR